MKIRCLFGHKWKDISVPVIERKPLGSEPGNYGPEETFYPDPYGPIKPRRECVNCGRKETNYGDHWA